MFAIPGERSLKLEIYPFTTKGLDHSENFSFNILANSTKRKNFLEDLEERDKKIKISKSFFQEMITTIAPNQEDEEEESDEESDKKKKAENSKAENNTNEEDKGPMDE